MDCRYTRLDQASANDVTVHNMLKQGADLETVILQLTRDKIALTGRIMELENIAPRRVRLPDGNSLIWHCPDEMVKER